MRRYVAPSLATPLLLACLSTITTAVQFEGFNQYTPYVPNDDPELKLEQLWTFEYNDKPTMLRFVPGSDAVITVGKMGVLRWYNSIDADKDKFTVMLDMSADVHSNADHGVQSLEFHPDWDLGVHTAFVLYTGEPKSVKTLPNEAAIKSMRPDGWGDDNGGYKWWDQCPCLDCEGTGQNENGLLCEHPYYIDRINIDVNKGKAKKDITLLQAACGASSSHGPGHLLRVGDDILFGVGDGSQFTIIDTGLPEDGCFDPDKGKGQGSLRAIRDDFNNGKIRRLPYNLMDSPKELEGDQVPVIAKGVRQPFRMFYHDKQDVLYIGDVGFGDTGTSERIFTMEGLGDPKKAPALPVSNFGWPCVEGVREYILGGLKIYDGPFERDLQKWYEAEGVDYCDSTMLAASAYVEQREASEDADPDWKAPVFEYRVGVMDKDYEDVCVSEFAALTSVHFYKGANMPAEYADKLMFSDYAKQCVWYFENKDGKPDTAKLPKTLLVGTGFVHLETGPDGALYGTDFVNGRIIRMSKIGGALATPAPTATPTKPTKAPTAAPTQPIPVDAAVMCFNPGAMPEFEWHQNGDGTYEGTLTLGAVELHTSKGFMRTFAYNGMLPGPIMRMKTCGKYTLNVINDLARWPAPEGGMMNTLHDPTVTNLHLHGLHVSGMAPGDDVSIMIEPGQTNKYTYTIPCDHSSGTNWYHPHNHGSSALQTTGGAYGLLVIESSARELADMPAAYAALPAQHLVFQDFNPPDTASFSAQSGDGVFATDIDGPLILVNGCEQVELVMEEGQWTRLNMLNSGHIYNSLVEIEVAKQDAEDCTIGLLQKDGAWLAQVPRMLEKKRANKLFFSLASRVDAVIMCPTAGVPHTISYSHIVDPTWESPVTVGTIRVVPSLRPAAKALPVWEPCRPAYLMDLNDMPDKKLGDAFALEVRTQLNGQLFTGPEDYLATMTVNKPQQWLVTGTDQHPLHIHVNHMQLGDITKANQWDEAPGWHVTGDFIDTLSAKAQVPVRVNPERFIGPMFLHCHVPSHADLGVLGVIDILGKGDDGEASPDIEDYGSCTKDIPNSKPYGERAIPVPGIVQAEEFDQGGAGVAYYNINGAPLSAPPMRDDEPVEIMPVQHGGVAGYGVTGIRAGEWLRFTVDVQRKGHYNVFFVQASKDLLQGVSMRLYKDAEECPKPSETKNLLARIKDTTYTGTGEMHDFVSLASNRRAKFDSTGKHKLLLCFDANAFPRGMVLDAVTLRYCGKTAKECKALEPKTPAPTPTPAPTAAPTAAEVGGPTVSPTAAPTAAADTAAAIFAESAGGGENAAAAAAWFGPAVTASLALIAGLVL